MINNTWSPAAAAVILAAVLGVSTASARSQTDPTVDPCSLVSPADVEQIVGRLKGQPASQRIERASVCTYTFASDEDSLDIWVFPASGLDRAKLRHKAAAPVTDLGHEALLNRNKEIDYLELYVRKGNATVEVSMKQGPGDEAKVKALARKALAKL